MTNFFKKSYFEITIGRVLQTLPIFFAVLVVALILPLVSLAQTTGDFRTNGAVTFASATNWQRYNGTAWVAAAAAPTSADGAIYINGLHTAQVTSNVTLDQLSVDGILQVNNGFTLTLNDGTGDDLFVRNRLFFQATGRIAGAGQLVLGNQAIVQTANVGGLAASITSTNPTLTAGASYWFNGTAAQSTGFTGFANLGDPLHFHFKNTAGITIDRNLTITGTLTADKNVPITIGSGVAFFSANAIYNGGSFNNCVGATIIPAFTNSAWASPKGVYQSPNSSEPTIESSNIWTNSHKNTAHLYWLQSGSGNNRIVVLKAGSSVSPTAAVDNSFYFASTNFGSGTSIDGGFVVYNGAGSQVNVTGLNEGITYHVAVFEYNQDCSGNRNYKTGAPLTTSFVATERPFITEWRTNDGTLTIPTFTGFPTATYNYTVSYRELPSGIPTVLTGRTTSTTLTGLTNGVTYEISISGQFPRIYMGGSTQANCEKIMNIKQWGSIEWTSLSEAFGRGYVSTRSCFFLNSDATDVPNLSKVTDMSDMFAGAFTFNGTNLANWNTASIVNMHSAFKSAASFNQPIGNWNTTNVTRMSQMFVDCSAFNQSIANWNTTKVNDMYSMFAGATNYNQPMNTWNVVNVGDMGSLFVNATNFNQPLNNWNTSNVVLMPVMFQYATNFNQPLHNWNTSSVTQMYSMFFGARNFNQPLNNWNVSSVNLMYSMFQGASSFNQPLNNWVTNNLSNINQMFSGATAFNQSLGAWNITNITDDGSAFSSMREMLNNCGMNTANYDATLMGWAAQNVKTGVRLGATGRSYSSIACAARNILTTGKSWVITGDTGDCISNTAPTLAATPTHSNVHSYTAVMGGNVTTGIGLSEVGIVWGLTANPTIADNKVVASGIVNTGSFAIFVQGLPAATTVHYRTYATNGGGTSYSNSASFTTLAAMTPNYINGQNAEFVIGQPNFTTSNSGTTSQNFNFQQGIAIDHRNGKLYVADSYNHRVLRFAYPITGNNPTAELVFGQPNMTTSTDNNGGLSASSLRYPEDVCVDNTGRLWVADQSNNRVLWFNNAHNISTNKPNANGVLGQADFTNNGANTTQSIMRGPTYLVVDNLGNLFVSEPVNNRILRFNHAATKANGANADGVLGQANFTSVTPNRGGAVNVNAFNSPAGLTMQGTTLWVADRANFRVLRYDNAAGKTDGANADGVLGQPNLISNAANRGSSTPSANSMNLPYDVSVDFNGNLWVADRDNHRVLRFDNALSKPNGADADGVLGQSNFTTGTSAVTQSGIYSPFSITTDWVNNKVLVSEGVNRRVLQFASGATPIIILSTLNLNAFSACVGTVSTEQNYSVTGANLTANISIVPPAGFEISTTTGGAFAATNPIVLTQTGGNVPTTTIYVRQALAATNGLSGNITHTSTGSNNPNKAIPTSLVNTTATPAVNITPTSSLIGSQTFTATAANIAGGTVMYDFQKNSISQQNSAVTTWNATGLVAGDVVRCIITVTGVTCLTTTTATSNTVTVTVTPSPFITEWITTDGTLTIPTTTGLTYNYTVSYRELPAGMPIVLTERTTSTPLTGLTNGVTYEVSITGTYPALNLSTTDRPKIRNIKQWGSIAWTSMENAFAGCSNLTYTATDAPDLSNVTSMVSMFNSATAFNGNIGSWNTANVINMASMFSDATAFNQNIGAWNVANVTNMSGMFSGATAFNQNIGSWNTANVTNIGGMFSNATAFNQNIGAWNVANVIHISFMFYGATSFNQNISTWNIEKITSLSAMFEGATAFNQNISTWNTANVTNMIQMFTNATSFNQNIGNWNTANVTNMASMFSGATAFNQNIDNWNTANVESMNNMFAGATSFNRNIGTWNVRNVAFMNSMLDNCGMNTANYDATLMGWATQNVKTGVRLGATGRKYCLGESARNTLISKGWTISGDSKDLTCSPSLPFITEWITTDGALTIPIRAGLTYNYTVSYRQLPAGMPIVSTANTTSITFLGLTNGVTYEVSITGTFPAFGTLPTEDRAKIRNIKQWGSIAWTTMGGAFFGCSNLTSTATDAPDLSNVTDMGGMFQGATAFNGNIGNWNTANVTNMAVMFRDATAFNQNIGAWNVANVTDMRGMFSGARAFNQNIGTWNTANVIHMYEMFNGATAFNQNIGNWNTARVNDMSNMFNNAAAFNGNIGNWNTANVIFMAQMFTNATAFNQNIDNWNTVNVGNMFSMFKGATAFNQNIGTLSVANVTNMTGMLDNCGMNSANYDATLIGWAAQNVRTDVNLGAIGRNYTAAACAARNILTTGKSWVITGDTGDCMSNVAPTLAVTPTHSNVHSYTAVMGGNVMTGIGLSEVGIVWGLTANPTIADNKVVASGIVSTGTFAIFVQGLPAATTVHYRAYATNGGGTSYSNSASFTTLAAMTQSYTNGQNAEFVIGQPNFTTKTLGLSSQKFSAPYSIAIDHRNSKLYVADGNNHRVLRFAYPITGNNPTAELVFGQPNMTTGTTNTGGLSASSLNVPLYVFVDNTGRLWVADYYNNRVLWFNNAHSISTNKPDANGVLGQTDFTSNGFATTQNRMNEPSSLVVDNSGNLFVSDLYNHRILRFNRAATKANGANADGVLGQANFTSGSLNRGGTVTANSLYAPAGLTMQGTTLWVTDRLNNRVLRYDNAATKGNGVNADVVLGQAGFNSNFANRGGSVTANNINTPQDVSVDFNGNLWVADRDNSRVLRFNNVLSKTNGANADGVLGQSSLTTWNSAITQSGMDFPAYLITDWVNNKVLVSDGGNSRALQFAGVATPTITLSTPNLNAFSACAGSVSSEQSYTVSGANLTANISIVPPTGFEISTTTGGAFVATNPMVLTQTGGNVATTTIYVRQSATANNGANGNISHISTGSNNPNRVIPTSTVNVLPTITTQPTAQTICVGANATFTIAATGAGVTYQWQDNSSGTFANITGANTATLNVTAVTTAMNGRQYRCIVSGTCTPSVTSDAVALNVNTLPAITTQPTAQTICTGANATFTIAATGTGVTYQWQDNSSGTFANITGANTATLNVTAVTTAMNGRQYRCIVSGTCTPSVTSTAVALTVNASPTITTQPTDQSTCITGNATFAVVASGAGLTYQWQEKVGAGAFANITNGGMYGGAATASLTLTGVTAGMASNQYQCIVSGTCTPAVTSAAVGLTVTVGTAINTQPSNQAGCIGATVNFATSASGSGFVTYQWQEKVGAAAFTNITNGGIYSGATSATLTLTGLTAGLNTNQYQCIATSDCGNATTTSVTLTINAPTSITTQPIAQTVCANTNTTFTVAGTGQGLVTYQWQEKVGAAAFVNITNGGVYGGATTASLTLTGITAGMNTNQYQCIVTATCGSVTSNAVALTVNALPTITTQPTAQTVCANANATFTVAATGAGVTYQWQDNSSGTFANITAATSATLTLTGVTTAMSGREYRCIVSGTCTPSVTSSAVALNVNALPAITTQPTAQTVCANANVTFTLATTGAGVTYQWQDNSSGTFANITGANAATLNLTAVTTAMNGRQYRCIVSGTCTPSVTSTAVALTVNALPTITTQPTAQTTCLTGNATFTVVALGAGVMYQWQDNSSGTFANITGANTATLNLTAVTTAMNGRQYRCIVSGTCTPSVTSSVVALNVNALPAITTQPTAQTVCANANATFAVAATGAGVTYQWQDNSSGTFANITGANTATLNVTAVTTAMNGRQYRCIVSGTCTPSVISDVVALTVNALPAITTQPTAQTTCLTGNATFTVVATGAGVTYQWQDNSSGTFANITGANTATLNLTAVTTAMNGRQYRCIVSGTCTPSVTSTAVALTVNALPAITTQPTAQIVCANATATFTVAATGAGLTYQWQEKVGAGAFANITNAGVYGGATTATLTLTNPTAAMSNNQYQCIVSGTCTPAATSNAVALTVTPVNVTPTLDNPVGLNLAVSAPAQTVNLAGIGMGVGDTGQNLTITATSSNVALIPNPTVTYTSPNATGSINITPVADQRGTAMITVTVTDNGGTACGAINNVVRTFMVNVGVMPPPPPPAPAAQTITFEEIPNKTFGDADFTLVARASSNLPVSFEVLTGAGSVLVVGNTVTIRRAGTVTIQATQSGNASFRAATPVSRTFTINKANQTINFGNLANVIWNSGSVGLSATSSANLPVSFAVTEGNNIASLSDGNILQFTQNTGSVSVTATQAGNENYNAATAVVRTFQVFPVPSVQHQIQVINAPRNVTFGTSPITLNATANSGLPVTITLVSGNATLNGNVLTITGAGNIVLRFSQAGNATWEAATTVERTITVDRANQMITITPPTNMVVNTSQTLVATSSSGLPVVVSIVSGTGTVNGLTVTPTAGNFLELEFTQVGNANVNAAPPVRVSLVVIPTLSLSTITGSRFCGGSIIRIEYTVTGLFASNNVFAVYLSDANGNFTNSRLLVGTANGQTSGTIVGNLPTNVPAGTGYRLRVEGLAPAVISTASTQTIEINPLPVQANIVQEEAALVSSVATGIQWFANGMAISGATNQRYTPTNAQADNENTLYTVVVTGSGGCTSVSNPVRYQKVVVTGVDDANLSAKLSVYPNPSSDKFMVELGMDKAGKVSLRMVDALGKEVYQQTVTTTTTNLKHEINLTDIASGVYVLMVNMDGKVAVKRVVKQ